MKKQSLVDLGKSFKLQHPGRFDETDDLELGRAVKANNPGVYTNFEEGVPPMPPKVESMSPDMRAGKRKYPWLPAVGGGLAGLAAMALLKSPAAASRATQIGYGLARAGIAGYGAGAGGAAEGMLEGQPKSYGEVLKDFAFQGAAPNAAGDLLVAGGGPAFQAAKNLLKPGMLHPDLAAVALHEDIPFTQAGLKKLQKTAHIDIPAQVDALASKATNSGKKYDLAGTIQKITDNLYDGNQYFSGLKNQPEITGDVERLSKTVSNILDDHPSGDITAEQALAFKRYSDKIGQRWTSKNFKQVPMNSAPIRVRFYNQLGNELRAQLHSDYPDIAALEQRSHKLQLLEPEVIRSIGQVQGSPIGTQLMQMAKVAAVGGAVGGITDPNHTQGIEAGALIGSLLARPNTRMLLAQLLGGKLGPIPTGAALREATRQLPRAGVLGYDFAQQQ